MAITKVINDLIDLNATDATKSLKMPSGAAYSGTAQDGMVRNDTDGDSQGSASTMQHFNGTDWKNYENLPNGITVDFLVVAGGGAGGKWGPGGGGGAGGLKTTTTYGGTESTLGLSLSTAYTVTVGPGGIPASNGTDSSFSGSFTGSPITSTGGGRGAGDNSNNYPAAAGGSGGGGSGEGGGDGNGTGTLNQGKDGGDGYAVSGGRAGGGGGGAGVAGANATTNGGNGGSGLEANIIGGTGNFYAGGGGGATQVASVGTGGSGGGGAGVGDSVTTSINGTLNTGGGGGGGGANSAGGGSGVVILRYPTASVSSHAVTGTLDTTADTAYPIANTAYYKLNDDALDSSGNGYNGIVSNITYAAGRFGNAAVFNGSNSNINNTVYNQYIGSVSIWFNSSSGGGFLFGSQNGSGSNKGIALITTSTQLRVYIARGSQPPAFDVTTTGSNNFFDGQWHHLVLTWDLSYNSSNNTFLYVDGVIKTQGIATTGGWVSGQNSTVPLVFGAYNSSGAGPFGGSLDQARVFSSAISAGNVTSLYNESTVNESTDGTDSILQFIGGTGTVTFS